MKKIIITGLHSTPAFALIDAIRDKKKDWNIIFVGRKYILDGDQGLSFEYKEAVRKKLKFYNLSTGKLVRNLSLDWFKNILKVFWGFFNSYKILRKEKPDMIISFGGYIAFPISILAFFSGIPVFLHEQTKQIGISNRVLSVIAKKIFISFEDTKKQFPFFVRSKVILSGNPVRAGVLQVRKRPFSFKKNKKVIYITGGSIGSHSLNLHIFNILTDLLKDYILIHQLGSVRKYKDFQKAEELAKKYDKDNQYFIREHFSEDELGFVYKNADLIISRSGANTFFEIIRIKKPAVLVPLPWSAGKEQLKQARILKKAGVAEIFNQNKSSKILLETIKKVFANYNKYKENFAYVSEKYTQKAEEIILSEIDKSIGGPA